MQRPQADARVAIIGDHVWVYGGHDASGPVGAVQRGNIGVAAAVGLPENPNTGKVFRWDVSDAANLPAARDDAAGWSANGALYLIGGADADGPRTELYWAIPTIAGDIPEWKHLPVSDLPGGLTGASALVTGPNAVLVGGETGDGALTSSVRANTAPMSPFFQVGLVGATIPGLKIDGEIGQQLGYLNAAGAGTLNFVILLLIGWAFAHKAQARAAIARVLRRR
jgi:N-acetylneuraminic acid mutarotase